MMKMRLCRIFVAAISAIVASNAASAGGASLTLSAHDVASAPLVIGKAGVERDEEGAFLCGAAPRGSGFLAFLALRVEKATRLTITPCMEIANPFGDRADWVGVDLSFDGVNYKPLAAVKGHRGKKREFVRFCEPLTVPCEGKARLFVRVRIGPWWYPKFPRFRWLRLDTESERARLAIDKGWTGDDFLTAFRNARTAQEPKPAPHMIYLCGPVEAILLWERHMKHDPIDAIVGLAGVSIRGWTEGEIVRLAQVFEAMGIPFMLRAGAPGAVDTSSEVANKVFSAAPTTCRGLFVGEVWNSDIAYQEYDYFLRLVEVANKRGKKFVWFEHGRDGRHGLGFWGWCMDQPRMFAGVFDRRFHKTLIPMHENNDPRSQMANLGIVMGAWLQGLVEEWGASVQNWWWNDAGYGRCSTCPPELITRMMALYLALGATWFEIEDSGMFLAWDEQGLPTRSTQWSGFLRAYRLLGNGWLRIPSKHDAISFPPVGFVLRKGESGRSCFDPHPWQPVVPSSYIPSRLYCVSNYRDELLPLTPCGFVPLFTPHAEVPKGFFPIETDGRRFWANDAEIDFSKALALVEKNSASLPFISHDACLVAWREKNGFKLLLLHPREKEPTSLTAHVEVRTDARALKDVQSREEFEVVAGVASVPLSRETTMRILVTRR